MSKKDNLVQIPASIVGFTPRQDRSWKITFETRELPGEEVAVLADNYQGEGWLVYSPNREVVRADVPEEPAEPGVKTPSERLRDVIYIYWKQRGGKGDFESFRRTVTEQFIEYIKSKLN